MTLSICKRSIYSLSSHFFYKLDSTTIEKKEICFKDVKLREWTIRKLKEKQECWLENKIETYVTCREYYPVYLSAIFTHSQQTMVHKGSIPVLIIGFHIQHTSYLKGKKIIKIIQKSRLCMSNSYFLPKMNRTFTFHQKDIYFID